MSPSDKDEAAALERKLENEELREEEREQRREARYWRDREVSDRLRDRALDLEARAHYFPSPINERRAALAKARADIWDDHSYRSNGYDCPPQAPIKGNWSFTSRRTARIYHLPTWLYYGATIPEECFKSEEQARRRGFRPSRIRR
ncbi:sunset domain-containing protein [Nocardioides stalactiti]|uniref:sunset domain-containing protein n=1 Tax=Nocardioides stalactiti TaxID=2755356 RepID=UPI0015FF22FB|nr:hypothetical protein [Nocardioides stalactiti]